MQDIETVNIGKKGITEAFLDELSKRFKNNKVVKVKLLKNAPFSDRKQAFHELEKQLLPQNIVLVNIRGRKAIYKKTS